MRKFIYIYISMVLTTGCGFSPNCDSPSLSTLSYPVQIILKGTQLFILNADENLRYCSSYITIMEVSESYPHPVSIISPANGKITFPGRMALSKYGIILTEKGEGRVLLMDYEGNIKDEESEGGNPQTLMFLKKEVTGAESDLVLTLNLTEGTATFYSLDAEDALNKIKEIELKPFNYSEGIFPVSATLVRSSLEVWIGFTRSDSLSIISVNPQSPSYLTETQRLSIAPTSGMEEIKTLAASREGVYATLTNPDSIIFIKNKTPEILQMFPFSIDIMKIIPEKEIAVISSFKESTITGISLLNFKTLWVEKMDDRIVDMVYDSSKNILYGVELKSGNIAIFNPDTGERI